MKKLQTLKEQLIKSKVGNPMSAQYVSGIVGGG